VISLDFELYWGVRDMMTISQYKDNLLGVRQAIPGILKLFQEFDIHATWATVGLLFFDSKGELLKHLPENKPEYTDQSFSPYLAIEHIGSSEQEDPFHYGLSLIEKINSVPNQEIGTHTFSHYYCLEKGQLKEQFRDDLKAAINIAKVRNAEVKSLVFPRNQVNPDYLSICRDLGILCYRGNEHSWLYRPDCTREESVFKRALRLIDSYVNLSGHHSYSINSIYAQTSPVNIPSSRFLRPFNPRLNVLNQLRLKRIINSLTFAAKNGQVYHLWWHPHNFGTYLGENLAMLRVILEHYCLLKKKYGMESVSMGKLAEELINP